MTEVLAFLLCILLAGLAVFQLFLMCGLPWGRSSWGGQTSVLATRLRVGSAISHIGRADRGKLTAAS